MRKIELSVALVTRNRPESLERCLESLRSQSVQPFEVIVSDDSDSSVAGQIEVIAHRWNCRYVNGPRRGLYANRNSAALACRGSHVRTMDDDHEFPDEHFRILTDCIESDPESVWILGERPNSLPATTRLNLPGELQPRGFLRTPSDYDDCFAISDGATVYPRPIFEHHLFLDAFEFGHMFSEFGARLKASGYRIKLCKRTHVIHHDRTGSRSFNDQKLERKSAFLASYLTYACHFPSLLRGIECLSWFMTLALLGSIKGRKNFGLYDYCVTWRIASRYRRLFQSAKQSDRLEISKTIAGPSPHSNA